ncbi:kin(snf2) (nucleomorph) [Hemiselmis andersenii]|uniref:Kin(Snf2) n=1 Tax=Hemiselmis andersenii TaxID=464988 RepID=A9BL46_HEMAN|nr:kin(snf2) [Hemiselmis andersenii]ABW98229.1 kin(snf2) [Hemiselmis andersenii]|mmetsp:Transcript_21720/g.50391  ORF Transcript_21720/g.50391 Transcript_21720/m.50391 type:complete len:404 (-) Transcript_21720:869-2080(-)
MEKNIDGKLKFVGSYIIDKTLGIGATGKVKLARHSKNGEKVGIKIIRKDLFYDKPSLRIKIQREISVMKLMFHPHIIKIFEVLEDSKYLFLIIEYASHGELFNYLVEKRRIQNREALRFFQQIVSGIEYCHKHRICHRDLKLENILLDENHDIKIADFGMASLSVPNAMLKTFCGSPHYASPEVVSNEPYNGMKADIWSCGVILYSLLTGKLPFDEENDNIRKLFNKIRFEPVKIPKIISANCRDLIQSLLTIEPVKRISIEKIKNHPWYKSSALPETCRTPIQDVNMASVRNQIFNPDPEILNFLLPLQLVKDQKTLTNVLSSKKPSLVRVLYRQLEWRRIKMDSLRDDKIHEAIERRKRILKQGKKENHEGLKNWKKNKNSRGFFGVKPFSRIGIYVNFYF